MIDISFFKPSYFYALFFLGVIVLIHLLRRPRTVNLRFSTLRFFQSGAVTTHRTRHVRKLLQLLIRCMLAALVIALFAQPFKKNNPISNLSSPQAVTFVWVDPTPSMDYREGDLSTGQVASALVDSLQQILPASSKLFLYDHVRNDFFLKEAAPLVYRSRHGPVHLDEAFQRCVANNEGSEHSTLLLISDFQKPFAQKLDTLKKEYPDVSVIAVSVIPEQPWNYHLEKVEFSPDDGGIITARVHASGRALRSGELSTVVENMRAGVVPAELSAGESVEMRVPARAAAKKVNRGEVRLHASDPLPFDNVSWFVSGMDLKKRVLIVGDKKENFVIGAALRVSGDGVWGPIVLRDGDELLYDELDSADLVIVNGLGKPSRALDALLAGRGGEQKAIIFSTGGSELVRSWGGALLAKAFPDFTAGSILELNSPLSPVLPDTISPLWKGFPRITSDEVRVYRVAKKIPGEELLRLSNGVALLSKASDKAGRSWIILGTPLGITDENNLCETGFFVPFLDRIARYARSQIRTPHESWVAGYIGKNPYYGTGTTALVLDSEGKQITTLQHQPGILFEKPGIYKIVPQGEPAYFIPVYADQSESIMHFELPSESEKESNFLVLRKEQFLAAMGKNSDRLLWYAPWVMVFVLLLVEIVLWERKRIT